ncbi:MAG: DUF1211 domain-containing protein [Burkholderiales bacterium]|nr:DUF1211 domain-containing protein [Burkholderiales bacterium]
MGKGRFEAFSDGVIAIIITIMVLELKVPHGESLEALMPLLPVFFSYVLSFVYIGIYWNNHHHMLHATHTISAASLWANLHLLFWLSLVPFTTGWMGENHFATIPSALYGFNLLMAALAYWLLQFALIRCAGENHLLRQAVGSDVKGKVSLFLYSLGIACALAVPYLSLAIYVVVALLWFIPDRRIEAALANHRAG